MATKTNKRECRVEVYNPASGKEVAVKATGRKKTIVLAQAKVKAADELRDFNGKLPDLRNLRATIMRQSGKFRQGKRIRTGRT